jgi:electron transport complex protein RnfC
LEVIDLAYTIKAGVYIEQFRHMRRSRIEAMPSPETVVIPHSNSALSVSVGDTVLKDQVIGASERANVHASIAGRVTEANSEFIKIEGDTALSSAELSPIAKKLGEVSADEIISVIREAGICEDEGLYRALTEAADKIDKIIINCCEEPPLSAIERLAVEHPASIVNGAKILLRLFGVKCAYIAIENTKTEAISNLAKAVAGSRMISVRTVEAKYPLSDDRPLAYLLGDGGITVDGDIFESGSAVFSAEICSAIYRAFASGAPYTYRFITVGGDCIKKHRNLMVPIGTSLFDIVEFCGGLVRQPKYLIDGGAMSGEAAISSDFYITKDTRGILLLSEHAVAELSEEEPCIRCGRCVSHCPMHLMPMYIAEYGRIEDYKKAEKYDAVLCMECGTCSYVCPSGRDNLAFIRKVKAELKSAGEKVQPENEVTDGE